MSSFAYLLTRKFKNRLREIFHRPSELVVLLIFVALVAFTLLGGGTALVPGHRDIGELYAIILALYALEFVMIAKNGFLNGASMFSMADVNLMFTSPKKSETMLVFGLFSQIGRSLMLGVFIVYQYTWIHNAYGVGVSVIFAAVIGYAAVAFLSQMFAMLLYSVTASSDVACKIAKTVFYGVIVAFVGGLLTKSFLSDEAMLTALVENANSLVMQFFPVAGFVRYGVVSAIEGAYRGVAISVGCFVLCVALFYLLVSRLKSDYYEDVLKATEVSFSAITARKEGKASENAPRNVKVGRTGFEKGEGATAIAQKHKIENRRGKVLALDMLSLVFAVITIGCALFIKDARIVFVMNIYFSVFTVGTGRWAKELLLPYVYLIPEPPFKKLVNMLKEQLPGSILEAVITFLPLYFILKSPLPLVLGFIVAKISFNLLFIGVNLVLQRFFGNSGNTALLIILYFLLAIGFSVPGIVVGIGAEILLPMTDGIMFFALAATNLILGAITIYCCRNILTTAEYNNK